MSWRTCKGAAALLALQILLRCSSMFDCYLTATLLHTLLLYVQVDAELWRFPDRTTAIGRMIDAYLTCKAEADDATMHLLFSANRWEKRCAPARNCF